MNVACTACPAKYAVPDERVRGKRARITCKHCGASIVVDGTLLGTSSEAQAPQGTRPARKTMMGMGRADVAASRAAQAARSSAPPGQTSLPPLPSIPAMSAPPMSSPVASAPPAGSAWLVALPEGRREPASLARIVDLYATGAIDGSTYVWREGMSEWRTPFAIPEIQAALADRGLQPNQTPPTAAPGSQRAGLDGQDEATHVGISVADVVRKRDVPPPPPSRVAGTKPAALGDEDEEFTIARPSSPIGLPPPRLPTEVAPTPSPVALPALSAVPPTASAPAAPQPQRPPPPPSVTAHAVPLPPSAVAHSAPSAATPSAVGLPAPRMPTDPPLPRRPTLPPLSSPRGRLPTLPGDTGLAGKTAPAAPGSIFRRPSPPPEAPIAAPPAPPPPPAPLASSPSAAELAASLPDEPPAPSPSAPPPSAVPASAPPASAPALSAEPASAPPANSPTPSSPAPSARPPISPELAAPVAAPASPPPSIPLAAAVMAAPSAPLAAAPPELLSQVQAVAAPAPGLDAPAHSGAPIALTWNARYEAQQRRQRTMTVGLVALLTAGVGGAALLLARPSPQPAKAPIAAAPAAAKPEPSPPLSAAPEPAPAPSATETAAPVASAEKPDAETTERAAKTRSAAARDDAPRAAAAPKRESARAAKANAADSSDSSASSSDDSVQVATPTKAETSEKADPSEPPPPPPAVGPPFDRETATQGLAAAAQRIGSCKTLSGPTGTATATITFATSGQVASASVGGDYSGTIVGACIANIFKSVSVPAFGGEPISVSKRFTLE